MVLLLFFDRLFLQGKGSKSPKIHVNVKKSSVLLVVVFYVVQNKNNLKVLVPVSGDLSRRECFSGGDLSLPYCFVCLFLIFCFI